MSDITLVQRYFELATQPDSDSYFALFADGATVRDEGRTHTGVAAIRAWRTQVPRVRYRVLAVEDSGPGRRAEVEIAGDFPGSPVTLGFDFEFTADGRIDRLAIG